MRSDTLDRQLEQICPSVWAGYYRWRSRTRIRFLHVSRIKATHPKTQHWVCSVIFISALMSFGSSWFMNCRESEEGGNGCTLRGEHALGDDLYTFSWVPEILLS